MQASLKASMYSPAYGDMLILFTLRQIDDCNAYVLYDITIDSVYVESGDYYYLIKPLVGSELRCLIIDYLNELYN